MKNTYLANFIREFIRFIVPKGKTSLIIRGSNKLSSLTKDKQYDYIVLTNCLEKEKDILSLLNSAYQHLKAHGRLVIIYKNYLHAFFLGILPHLARSSNTNYNWLSTNDIKTFLALTNFDFLTHQPLCFIKSPLPLITMLLNRLILFLFPFSHLAFLHYIVAIKKPSRVKDASVSIIIPARNEAGNIKKLFAGMPKLGKGSEIIFVEDHSTDDTARIITKYLKLKKPQKNMSYRYFILKDGKGKFDAVRLGLDSAKGEILMIYDADMTVAASDLYKFYQAAVTCKGDFNDTPRSKLRGILPVIPGLTWDPYNIDMDSRSSRE